MKTALCSTLVVVTLIAVGAHAESQTVRFDPERAEYMRAHFGKAIVVRAAVIRGDLPAVASAARALSDEESPASLPSGSERHVAALRDASRQAAGATSVAAAAYSTAFMLNACGDCHRAVGTMPAMPLTPRPKLGGVVGHMLAHQQAADQLLQGLMTPSTSLWQAGAKGFAAAPLHPRDLPVSAEVRREMASAEERIHRIATDAFQATDSLARASFYGQILTGCADCHKRHATLWGPKPW
jgi:hypothetical protein